MSLNPCLTCSQSTTGSFVIIGLTYAESVLYPLITTPIYVSVGQRQMTVTVNIYNHTGTVYCAALATGTTVSSVVTIQQAATSATVRSSGNVSVTLSSLVPDTTYDVYCYTQDFSNHVMPLSTALSTKQTRTTSCCRSVTFSTLSTKILSSTTYSSSSSVNVLKLEALPSTNIAVKFSMTAYSCSWQIDGTTSLAYTVPSFSNFTSTSSSSALSFIMLGTPGCYILSTSISGTDRAHYSNVNATIILRSSLTTPSPPTLQSAVFSSDGLRVSISLDSASDRGATTITNYASTFTCSQLLTFSGASLCNCIWSSTSVITATISSTSSTASLLTVGSNITLQQNKIKAVCSFGLTCAYANASYVIVTSPSSPIVPTVALVTAGKIGGCDSIVIDPTASVGSGGRQWKSVSWAVSGTGTKIFSQNLSTIAAYLKANYTTTAKLVTIPNSLLSYGTYAIGLTLTNFLGQSGFNQVSVVVSDSLVIPRLSIAGSTSVSMYRYQALSVFANASFPACVSNPVSLVYTWSLFQGSTLQYSISSFAKDPRFYRLSTYTLTASTSYLLRVLVSLTSTPSVSLTTAQIAVNVGQSGVSATISGGAVQTFGAGSTLVLDATDSVDVDYPTSSLSYQWSCSEISPYFGDDCKNFSSAVTNSSTLSILSSILTENAAQTELKMSVYVSNTDGFSATASITAIVLKVLTPVLSIQAAKAVYNVGDTVTVTGLLYSTASLEAAWTIVDSTVTLSAISSNSKLSRSFTTAGYNAFDLGISANSLVAGLSYTFQLSAAYTGVNTSAYAQVTVTMNSPPSSGSIDVTPTIGDALSTAFYMVTADWVDDASDYPFSYIFSYYTTTAAKTVVVKNLDAKSYVTSVLGQGLQGNNYLVTCIAIVVDAFNGTASVTTTVTVNPITNTSVLATQTTASLNTALDNYDPGAVAQIIGATTSSVNAANCTVPVPCLSINRENCSFTANTCGSCLSGYIGISGDSNVACFVANTTYVATSCTSADASKVCASGKCSVDGICVEADKTCTNNCSYAVDGNGHCVFYDVNNFLSDSCPQSNSYCRAACECNDGYYGSDCSLTLSSLEAVKTIRDAMCVGLYKTLSIQDVTSDVVTSRATSIANILLDATQLSDDGFANCTVALIDTVRGDPELAGSGATATLCMEALSTVLQKGSGLSSALVTNISSTLTYLTNGMQASMAIGQQTVELTTANVRMSSSLQTANDIDSSTFAPPLTAYEKYLGVNATTLGVNTSTAGIDSNSAVGVALTQYTSNPHGKVSAATSTGLALSAYSAGTVSSTGRRRRLSTSGEVALTIVMNNLASESYYEYEATSGAAYCEALGSSYNVTVICNVTNQTVTCSGQEVEYVNYTCPEVTFLPKCDIWNGVKYSPSPSCSVASYTSTTTTCLCTTAAPTAVSDGSVADSELQEFATSAMLVVGTFLSTLTSAANLSLSSITRNSVIFSLMVVIVCISIGGVYFSVRIDQKELAARTELLKTPAKKFVVKSFEEMFLSWRPKELTDSPWYIKLWKKILADHQYISMFSGYHSISDYRTTKLIQVVGLIINMLFVDTILSVLFFYDDGSCGTYITEDACVALTSLDPDQTLCVWSATSSSCSFNDSVGGTFESTLILTAIITTMAIPFQMFFESMVDAIRDYFCVNYLKKLMMDPNGSMHEGIRLDIEDIQTWRCTMLRAARLTKMKELMDDVTVEQEVEILRSQVEQDLNRPVFEMLGMHNAIRINSTSLSQPDGGSNSISPRLETGSAHGPAGVESSVDGDNRSVDEDDDLDNGVRSEQIHRNVKVPWMNIVRGLRAKSLVSHHFMDQLSAEKLTKKIERTRQREAEILNMLDHTVSVTARNKILMQQFVANLLSGFRKQIALQFFEYSSRESAHGTEIGWYHYFSLIVFPIYLFGTCFYIFLFGVQLGSHTTNNWLLGGLVSILEDMFLLIPLKLYLKWIAMSQVIIPDVQVIYQHLQRKVRLIMLRSGGLIKNANGMIHHLNPACRAARKHPGLAVSRLLISITDDDLPRNLADPQLLSVSGSLQLVWFVVVLAIALLPEIMQDILFEASAVGAVGGILLILVQLGKLSVAIPIILMLVGVGGPVIYLFIEHRNRKAQASVHVDDVGAATADKYAVDDDDNNDNDRWTRKYDGIDLEARRLSVATGDDNNLSPATSPDRNSIILPSSSPPMVSMELDKLLEESEKDDDDDEDGNDDDDERPTPSPPVKPLVHHVHLRPIVPEDHESPEDTRYDETKFNSQNYARNNYRSRDNYSRHSSIASQTDQTGHSDSSFQYEDSSTLMSNLYMNNDYSFYSNPMYTHPPNNDHNIAHAHRPSMQSVSRRDSGASQAAFDVPTPNNSLFVQVHVSSFTEESDSPREDGLSKPPLSGDHGNSSLDSPLIRKAPRTSAASSSSSRAGIAFDHPFKPRTSFTPVLTSITFDELFGAQATTDMSTVTENLINVYIPQHENSASVKELFADSSQLPFTGV
jgi:hypothetical protein